MHEHVHQRVVDGTAEQFLVALPAAKVIDFASWPARLETTKAGLLLAIPDLVSLDLPALAAAAGYPGTRVIPAVSLGRDAPTVIITNDTQIKTRALVQQYARRMTIEQRLAEIIRAFSADALSSAVNLKVDLDVLLAVLAQALTAALRNRLPGYDAVTPRHHPAAVPRNPGQVITDGDAITVRLERRTYSPVLRKADLPAATPVPWWGGRAIRYELA